MTTLTFRSRCGKFTMFCEFSAMQISVRLEQAQGPITMINLFREDALRLKYQGGNRDPRVHIFLRGINNVAQMFRTHRFTGADRQTFAVCLELLCDLWEEESGFWTDVGYSLKFSREDFLAMASRVPL